MLSMKKKILDFDGCEGFACLAAKRQVIEEMEAEKASKLQGLIKLNQRADALLQKVDEAIKRAEKASKRIRLIRAGECAAKQLRSGKISLFSLMRLSDEKTHGAFIEVIL